MEQEKECAAAAAASGKINVGLYHISDEKPLEATKFPLTPEKERSRERSGFDHGQHKQSLENIDGHIEESEDDPSKAGYEADDEQEDTNDTRSPPGRTALLRPCAPWREPRTTEKYLKALRRKRQGIALSIEPYSRPPAIEHDKSNLEEREQVKNETTKSDLDYPDAFGRESGG